MNLVNIVTRLVKTIKQNRLLSTSGFRGRTGFGAPGVDISAGCLISYHRLTGAVHISLRNTNRAVTGFSYHATDYPLIYTEI
jgi:hypothetical protein